MIRCIKCNYHVHLDSTKEKGYCKDCKKWTHLEEEPKKWQKQKDMK